MITNGTFTEQSLQFPNRQWQQFQQSEQYLPLLVNVSWFWQVAGTQQVFMHTRQVAQLLDECIQGFLLPFVTRREAVVLVDTFSPVAGFGQQQSGDCLPRKTIARRIAGQLVAAANPTQRMFRMITLQQIVDGVANQGQQFGRTACREMAAHARQLLHDNALDILFELLTCRGCVAGI